jgi:hypothetical protein
MGVPACNPSAVLGRQRQEHLEFKASLRYVVNSRPAGAT